MIRLRGLDYEKPLLASSAASSPELLKQLEPAGGKTGPDVIGPYAPAVDKVSGQNIRQIRVLLPKDRSLARNKGILAATVERFEKERKYSGHIALDVDPA